MKKKGFSLKRAVSLLLAAAMIITAAPQTSLTALAAEPGAVLENPDVSEGLEVLTVEDGDIGDNGIDVPSDDVGGTEDGSDEQPDDPDDADQSENVGGGTQDPVDPDDTNQNDETEDADQSEDTDRSDEDGDAGESDEATEPEEGVDSEPAEDDETETEVDSGKKYLAAGLMEVTKPAYTGEIVEEPDGENDGVTRYILEINEYDASEAGTTVTAILEYYYALAQGAEEEEEGVLEGEDEPGEEEESIPTQFDEIRLNFNTDSVITNQQTIKAEYVNAAREILRDDGSINYSIYSEKSNEDVSYNLQRPHGMNDGDYSVKFTAALKQHWGVVVSLDRTDFPADGTYISYIFHEEEADDAAECFWAGGDGAELGLFAWDGSVPTGALGISEYGIDYDDKSDHDTQDHFRIGFSLDEAIYSQSGVALEPTKEYLFACVKNDEDISMGETGTSVEVGKHAGEAESISIDKTVSLNEDILEIESGEGKNVTLTAVGVGTTYYYVTYLASGKTYSEIHKVTTNQQIDGDKVLNYVGDISQAWNEEVQDYTDEQELRIDEAIAKSENKGYDNGDSIPDILKYHKEKGHKFSFIEFNTYVDDVSTEMTLKQEYINGAIDINDDEDGNYLGGNYSIGYGFQQEAQAGEQSDTYPHIKVSYNMWRPEEIEDDIQVILNVGSKPDQGVLFNLSNTDFPAEGFNFSYRVEARDRSDISECLGGTEGEFAILSWDNGTPTRLVESNWISLYEEEYDNNGTVYVSDIGVDLSEEMEAGKDYLITPLYRDENVQVGGEQPLEAGLRSDSKDLKDVKWTVLSQDLISIEPGDGIEATLTANGMGDAYYYVTYVSDSEDKNYLELHAVRTVVGAGLSYLGEINDTETTWNEDGEEVHYRRLMINEWEAKERNGENSTIADILAYYAEQIEAEEVEPFNCVQLDMMDFLSPMEADNINGAISVMNWNEEKLTPWMDYNRWDDETQAGINYTLFGLHRVEGDTSIDATFAVELMPHQGVKVKTATAAADFPAEYVSVSFNKEQKDAFADCFELEPVESEESDRRTDHLRLMALEDGVVPSVMEPEGLWVDEYEYDEESGAKGSNFGLSLEGLEAGKDYLITPLYADEETVPMGGTIQVSAGQRSDNGEVSGVTWKSLDKELISSIEPGTDGTATLTAGSSNFGTAHYSVSYTSGGNTYLELHSIEVTFAVPDSGELAYVGEVIDEVFDDDEYAGMHYLRLRIDEQEAIEKNKDADITVILKFYEDLGMKFNCIEFNMLDASPTARVMKKDYINGARSIMDWSKEDITPWMDYNFRDDANNSGVSFTLNDLREVSSDVKASFTLTELKNQGLKVKFDAKEFPAEYVNMRYDMQGKKYADSMISDRSFRLVTHSSGTPKTLVDVSQEQGWGYYNSGGEGDDSWTNIYFNNIATLGTTEYLAVSVYNDDDDNIRPVVAEPEQLEAGKRAGVPASSASSVTWGLFDTSKATIDKDGKLTAWSADGEIYYYVRYQANSQQYLELHEMHAKSRPVEIYFDEKEIELEMGDNPDDPRREFLRLRFKPSEAERDTHNPDEIRWEITENNSEDGSPVIDFVYYDDNWNEVERDEDGNPPEKAAPNGNIKAINPGTATVKVTYLDVEEGVTPPTATCKVTVLRTIQWEEVEDQVNSMDLYAVMDVDTKLSDVKFDDAAHWTWQAPNTPLANFKGMYDHPFAATYTADDGRTLSTLLWVRFFNITGVTITSKNENKQEGQKGPDWYNWVSDSIVQGDKITLGYSYDVENIDWIFDEEIGEDRMDPTEYKKVKDKFETNYSVDWTSSPANAGTVDEKDNTFQFTAPSVTKAQKTTFTVSVKNEKTNKVFLKNSHAITVTVKPLFDFDLVEGPWFDTENGQIYLNYRVGMEKAEYESRPLTIVSEDTAILKLTGKVVVTEEEEEVVGESGEQETVKYTLLRVPCTNLKPGTAWIKLTASDEMKSYRRDWYEFIDKEPKPDVSSVTINRALEDKSATVTVRTHMKYPLQYSLDTGEIALLLNGQSTNDIKASVIGTEFIRNGNEGEVDEENSYNDYRIKLELQGNATGVKTGKNTVTLNLEVKPTDGKDSEKHQLTLTVNITNVVPKVTFKQTKKFNNFYKDEEGYGILTVNANGAVVKDLKLSASGSAACNFEVKQIPIPIYDEEGNEVKDENGNTVYEEENGDIVYRENEYYIVLTGADYTKNKKGVLTYKLEGFGNTEYTANLTVSTENKKPTIVLSQKSDTLYPKAGYFNSWLRLSDKVTGEDIVPSAVWYVKDKNTKDVLTIEKEDVDWDHHTGEYAVEPVDAGKDNKYNLLATTWGGIVFMLQERDDGQYKSKTQKFNLEVQAANWRDPIAVSYSIKTDTAKPKLVLGKSTLTLNKNSAVYRTQQVRTSLHLKGTSDSVYQDGWHWVNFEGQDAKSKKVLRQDNSLVLQYRDDQGDIVVRFNDNTMDTGTYKFTVNVGNNGVGLVASTVLTVKIVDTPIDKVLKVTAKGSIDVMNREGTSITYTPKISNISGEVVDGWLEGTDRDMFDYWWDGSKLVVKASGHTYCRKHTYQVRAAFRVDTWEYEGLTVRTDAAKPLSIKVKQSKPKLTASTAGNTIYRQLDNSVEIKLSAMLNKQEVDIDDVWLLNYDDDFELRTTPASWTDEDGEEQWYDAIYNPGTKSVRLGLNSRYHARDTVKSGKALKVKLAVRYREQAGNEKPAQVTCSIVVR